MVLTFRKACDRIRIALKEIKSKNKKKLSNIPPSTLEKIKFNNIELSVRLFTEFERRFEIKVYKIVIGFLTYFRNAKKLRK